MLLVTEGGYDLTALAASLEASLLVMAGGEEPVGANAGAQPPFARGERAAAQARAVQARYWRGL
jgi:acetoin utilization deacetylase AcuC-like enzyme